MKITRRDMLAGAATLVTAASATTGTAATSGRAAPLARVTTLNGRSLESQWVDGARQFHLVAQEVEHEFAPGCTARCWGYNGSTPGPTIEAVEGETVRILVTNQLPEPTTIHWHGLLLPNGMDGISGLNQPPILPGETWAYEFTLRQHGTCMYHPHADEMTQLAFGMMGLFIIHPRVPLDPPVDRDFAFLLHNWALHPGTYRPDPNVMTEFDLWTFNSKVYPAIDTLVVGQGERVRLRIGNLSMHNHPIHLHGHRFWVTGSDAGRWPRTLWRPEITEIIGVGQMRDLEFVADNPGDWALHCHMSHHTMNAMAHDIANPVGVQQDDLTARIRRHLPGYSPMGANGMYEHALHAGMGHMRGPANTLPMAMGQGPFGPIGMGGMMTVIKIRKGLRDGSDPGWYDSNAVPRARKVGNAPVPVAAPASPPVSTEPAAEPAGGHDHHQHHNHHQH